MNEHDRQEDWMPPELLQRAQVAAQREEESARRRESGAAGGKGKQRVVKPRKEFPRTAAWALGVSVLLLVLDWLLKLLGVGGAALSKGRGVLGFSAAVAVTTLLLSLVLLLPMPKLRHRSWLLPLLALGLGFNYALGLLQNSGMENVAARALSVAGAMFFLPLTWLLLGVALRKRTERFAACVAVLASLLCIVGARSEQGEGFSVSTVLTALHYLSLGVALWCSPVTFKAVLSRPAAGNSTPADSEAAP